MSWKVCWRVEVIEGGKTRPDGRFSHEVGALKWAHELASLRETVLVWRCWRKVGLPEERTLVRRFQREDLANGNRGGFSGGSGGV
jgi:hypothetical protein